MRKELGLDFLDKNGRRAKSVKGKGEKHKKGSGTGTALGKSTSGRFNIDFRYPMSPIQAFVGNF